MAFSVLVKPWWTFVVSWHISVTLIKCHWPGWNVTGPSKFLLADSQKGDKSKLQLEVGYDQHKTWSLKRSKQDSLDLGSPMMKGTFISQYLQCRSAKGCKIYERPHNWLLLLIVLFTCGLSENLEKLLRHYISTRAPGGATNSNCTNHIAYCLLAGCGLWHKKHSGIHWLSQKYRVRSAFD